MGFFGKVFGFRAPPVFRGQAERLSYVGKEREEEFFGFQVHLSMENKNQNGEWT
jgi:hypothetical protein